MSNKAKISIIIAFVAFSTWFYFTPHLAVSGMRSAAESNDAEKLSDYVNFPALKENLKASFNAKLAKNVVNDANPFSTLGALMAAALVNPMIDALVTPESLAMMMKGNKPQPTANFPQSKSSDIDVDTSMSYKGFNRFIVTVKKKGANEEPLGLELIRK